VPTFRSADGVEICYYTWGPTAGQPVVLHHGFMGSAQHSWEEHGLVAALVGAGHRVVALDARGHGRSGKPHDKAFYGETKMADDLIGLLDVLGSSRVDVAGYSMGAVVGLLAATRDRRIARLAVGGVGAPTVTELTDDDRRARQRKGIAAALRAADPSEITSKSAAAFRTVADYVGGDRLALAAHAEVLHSRPIALDQVTARTLVLAGTDDPLAARPDELVKAIPDAALAILPGDHLSVPTSAAFAMALVEFFRGC
jgi:pimeloyl-ACP methyl ester carboxylesterase